MSIIKKLFSPTRLSLPPGDLQDLIHDLADKAILSAIPEYVASYLGEVFSIEPIELAQRSIEFQRMGQSAEVSHGHYLTHSPAEDDIFIISDDCPVRTEIAELIEADELFVYLRDSIKAPCMEGTILDSSVDYHEVEDNFADIYDMFISDLAQRYVCESLDKCNAKDLVVDDEYIFLHVMPSLSKFRDGYEYSIGDALTTPSPSNYGVIEDFVKVLGATRNNILDAFIESSIEPGPARAEIFKVVSSIELSSFPKVNSMELNVDQVGNKLTSVIQPLLSPSGYSDLVSLTFAMKVSDFLSRDLSKPLQISGSACLMNFCPVNGGYGDAVAVSLNNYIVDVSSLVCKTELSYTPQKTCDIRPRDYIAKITSSADQVVAEPPVQKAC